MTINFNLFTPAKKVSAIRVVINHKGKAYRRSTGISCNTADWSVKKQRCANIDKEDKLKTLRIKLEENLNEFSTPEEISSVLDWALSGSSDKYTSKLINGKICPSFWSYYEEVKERDCKTIVTRRCLYNKVKELMGTNDNWDDIDSAWYFRLTRAMEDAKLSRNTQGVIIAAIKSVMKEGLKLKYHTNMAFLDFRRPYEDSDAIYLTEEELSRLWKVELTDKKQKKARDLFLLGVYTASRVSDCSRLTIDNIVDNTLRFTQLKTGQSVIMPLSPKVKLLLERNGGEAPHIQLGIYNAEIKKVCKAAGICQQVEVTRTLGATPETKRLPKYKFVGSHTARRTGATLLYMSGVPMKSCMYITGHQSEANFMRYIRLTKEENAKKLADTPFFK